MDASTNFSLIQLILVWTLLGFLLIWMVVFAVLAFRSHSRETLALEDVPARPRVRPVISMFPKPHRVTSSPFPSAVVAETVYTESPLPSEAIAKL